MTLTRLTSGFPWLLFMALAVLAGTGTLILYSAGGMDWQPWAGKHLLYFGVMTGLAAIVAAIPLHVWQLLAWPYYAVCVLALVAVEVAGDIGMGAQRWIDLGFIRLQPSELMKVALVLVLARRFGDVDMAKLRRLRFWMPSLLLIAIPVVLVLLQPNLGTAMLLAAAGLAVLFVAGVPMWFFVGGFLVVALSVPVAWQFGLHDYQKRRVMTFLDPSQDPLGAGFHITQSKIAFGSGGFWGRGYGQGPQTQLSFLPEKHNDFVFASIAEEFGFLGGTGVLALAGLVLACGWRIAQRARNGFGRLLAVGLTVNFFLYVLINTGMVMGLFPVVGIPFPLVSDGGTAMMTIMIAAGLLASVARDGKKKGRGSLN